MKVPFLKQSPAPLDFALWDVQAETVRDNLVTFSLETDIAVQARIVNGAYHSILEAEFAAGRGPDVFYAQRAEAALWGHEERISPLDAENSVLAPVLAQMDQRLVVGARDANGRLLGMTYYNGGPFALFLREGLESPATWRGFLALMRNCKRDGQARHPFVPRWHSSQTGLVWSLLCHLATEGVYTLHEEGAVEAVAETLSIWSAMVVEELVPRGSLNDKGDYPALERWARGDHCATFTMDYLAADAFGLRGGPAGVPVPLPGAAGTPLMPGHALLCLRAGLAGARRDEALALVAWLGGPEVHRRWQRDHFFPVAFEMTDTSRHAYLFPALVAQASLERINADRDRAITSPVTQSSGALRWTAMADREIRLALADRGADLSATARRVIEGWRG